MSKKAYIFITLILGCLVISGTGFYFYLKTQNQMAQRHHLVCEVLKPGMSKGEVKTIINRVGSYTTSQADWGNGFFVFDVKFTNPKIDAQYGYFELVFFDYQYVRAVIPHGSDNPEIICDFYKLIESTTETPKPSP